MVQRIVTGVVAGAVFAGLLLLGGWFYAGLLLVMAMIGFAEYVKLNGQARSRWDVAAAFAAVFLLTLTRLPDGWAISLPSFETVAWILMFLLLAATVFSKNETSLDHAALLFVGAIYVGTGFHYMLATRELEHGIFWSAVTFVCIWSSDAGAYFVGKSIGRTKLWPAISPNKTVEGSVGGLVLAVAAGLAFAWWKPEWLGYGQAAAIGAVAAVCGQLGDLVQSAYKRLRGVKDSGQLLPGHGGILDRTDSWLIVFPIVHLLGLLTTAG
ncbi:phosphatidate cytidylyltransferase [Cohnella sp. CFH 77786]|uniref:phosphatidate cytidylyltransferase n=1 Tax=Cohnella sp. CFH 77786 TaxID=2662265 RepID=UPI001C60CFC7|nr:phosphatidate cytidylyltransferase [Cohnella sp. CFH 77786]MBW5444539.1 phosphatidate cytidylyltransferase [Cohnella sp. CFH 77786]